MRLLTFCASILLAADASAGSGDARNGLASARALFAAADRDGDGRLVLAELRERRVVTTAAEFQAGDADGDGAWSSDEYTVHHRALLLRGGERPAADLEAEVVRILALRRARTVDEARARGGPAAGRLSGSVGAGLGATPALLDLDARLERAISDLEDRAAGRGAVKGDFERVRTLWNERVTEVRVLEGATGTSVDLSPRFLRALETLEGLARAGSVERARFGELRAVWGERPRRAVATAVPAAGPTIEARFENALADLETRAAARTSRAADWARVRELVPERARRFVQGGGRELPAVDDPRVVRAASEFQRALLDLESRAAKGPLGRADFVALRTRFLSTPPKPPGPSERDATR